MSDLERHADQLIQADERLIRDLIDCRKIMGLTQDDVARRMGIATDDLQRIEGYGEDLCLPTLRRYALSIGVVIQHHVTFFEDETDE